MDKFQLDAELLNNNAGSAWTTIPSNARTSCAIYLVATTSVPLLPAQHASETMLELPDELLSLEEPNLLHDAVAAMPPAPAQPTSAALVVFHFSIIYHDTWQVPVLYWHTTPPLPRSTTLSLLSLPNNASEVSQERHPITHRPAFFCHPCFTQETLHLMNTPSPLFSFLTIVSPLINVPFPPALYNDLIASLPLS